MENEVICNCICVECGKNFWVIAGMSDFCSLDCSILHHEMLRNVGEE